MLDRLLNTWKRTPKNDTTACLFRQSPAGSKLHNHVCGSVAHQVLKDIYEHLCNLLGTRLPRFVEELVKDIGEVREKHLTHTHTHPSERTCGVDVNLLL